MIVLIYYIGAQGAGKSALVKSLLVWGKYYAAESRRKTASRLVQNIAREFIFSMMDCVTEFENANPRSVDGV